jgi:FixJ family two-component response regulator
MTAPTVFVVDDDEAVRQALCMLIRSVGMTVEAYSTGAEFLSTYDNARAGCLILDLRMPGLSGLQVQDQLAARGALLPILFITGHGDVPVAVRALKAGALDFIEKPFNDQDLLDRVHKALRVDAARREAAAEVAGVRSRYERLTPREREILEHLYEGRSNKETARDLELSERTVELHRARVMEKMGAESLPALVRQIARLKEP